MPQIKDLKLPFVSEAMLVERVAVVMVVVETATMVEK